MSLLIALGSNLGDSLSLLHEGFTQLCQSLRPIALSRPYRSKAVGHTDQPDFINQVAEFEKSQLSAHEVLKLLLKIEHSLGRRRDIAMGPRTLDLDLLFYEDEILESPDLILPHPRLWERSFVVLPLQELPAFGQLQKKFSFDRPLIGDATPLENSQTIFF